MRLRKKAVLFSTIALLVVSTGVWAYEGTADPDLRAGFPVKTINAVATTTLGNQQSNVAVGDIDGDGKLEIIFPTPGWNYVYAIRPDGSVVTGWPVGVGVTPLVTLGHILGDPTKYDVFVGSYGGEYYLLDGAGAIQSGWPIASLINQSTSPAVLDVDGDGYDEIFVNPTDGVEYEYDYLGNKVDEFDSKCFQTLSTPLLVQAAGSTVIGFSCLDLFKPGNNLVKHVNGGDTGFSTVGLVSAVFKAGATPTVVTAGLYGDKNNPALAQNNGTGTKVSFYDLSGNLTGSFISPATNEYIAGRESGQNGAVQPVLADLDGDGIPEIILQGAGSVYVYRKDGTPFPGWPVNLELPDHKNSDEPIAVDYSPQPAVGDIDGDGQPDIVFTYAGYVAAYDRFGRLIPGFPKNLNSDPKVNCDFDGIDFQIMDPAIADVDGDGFNELIVGGSRFPCNSSPDVPTLFVYDLGGFPGGRVEWGQFRGNPERTGVYQGPITGNPDIDIGYSINYAQPSLVTATSNHATVTITNHSPTAATNVTFNLTFPNTSDAALVQVSGKNFQCLSLSGRHMCRIAALGPDQSVSLNLTIVSTVPVKSSADIQVSHDGYEHHLDDNFGEVTFDIALAVVSVATKTFTAYENQTIFDTLPVNIPRSNNPPTLVITQRAAHGLALPEGSTGFTYTPNRGYAGTDSFAYEITYNGKIYKGTIVIIVKSTTQGGSGGGHLGLLSVIALILIAGWRRVRP